MDPGIDIDVHLSEHGRAATYFNAIGTPKQIRIIYSPESYVEGQVMNVSAVNTTTLASAKSSDVPSADNRCRLRVGTVTYNVVEAKAYGDGWTIMTLSLD